MKEFSIFIVAMFYLASSQSAPVAELAQMTSSTFIALLDFMAISYIGVILGIYIPDKYLDNQYMDHLADDKLKAEFAKARAINSVGIYIVIATILYKVF